MIVFKWKRISGVICWVLASHVEEDRYSIPLNPNRFMVEMGDGDVLISGFLRKSPPETKFKVSSVSSKCEIHSSARTCMVRIDFKWASAYIWLHPSFVKGFSYLSISWVGSIAYIAYILDQYIFISFIPRRIDRRSSMCSRIKFVYSFTTIWRDFVVSSLYQCSFQCSFCCFTWSPASKCLSCLWMRQKK